MALPAPAAISALPSSPGVYRFRDESGRVIYVGRATSLRHRVASYWGDLRDRRHLRRMIPQVTRVEAIVCASVHEATWLERNLLERSKPRWNHVRGGLEVPTYIQLERRSSSARLAVLHSPDAAAGDLIFGPYLGGTRTRAAVSGLERVLSLGYASDRLGGFDRDMARMRGVTAGERDDRVATAIAVLDHDREAFALVRELLVARRDDAAAALAYESAARISDEVAALEWVTAEQKVTVPGAPDADAAGWSDGLLVRLEIRGGRMNRWEQRECSARTAEAHVAATPAAWAAFADHAAVLASALRPE